MKFFIWEIREKVDFSDSDWAWRFVRYFDTRSEARWYVKKQLFNKNFKIVKVNKGVLLEKYNSFNYWWW